MNNLSFKLKLYLTFLAYGLVLFLLTQFILLKVDQYTLIYNAHEVSKEKHALYNAYIKDVDKKLKSLKNSFTLNKYLIDRSYKNHAKSLFLDITKSSDKIMRLRYINKNGIEQIRIDRDLSTLKPFIVKNRKLLNIRKKDCFKNILTTKKDNNFYSKLTFGAKNKKIKKYIEPIIHIGTPIFIKDKKVGILIIDVFMKDFLEELAYDTSNKIYIFDNEGNTLIDPDHINSWSKHLGNKSSIAEYFKDESEEIKNNNEYLGDTFYSNRISLFNSRVMYMVVKPQEYNLKYELIKNAKDSALSILVLFLLSIPMAYIFSRLHTKQKKKDDKYKYNQDVLLSLFDLSDVVLFKWNNDEKWTVDSVSKSVAKLLGYTKEEFENNNIYYTDCIHPDDLEQVTQEHINSISYRAYYFEHKPYRLVRKDGDLKWILHSTVIVRDNENNIISFVGYLTDITELKNREIELKNISRTDRLTKINNRMYTDDVLENQYYRFKRDKELCSVILVDIDHFKSVNDTYGHLVGDNVLIEFARILGTSLRKGDVLGRWGGEEFLIILPHTKLEDAMKSAEKLRKIVDKNKFPTLDHLTASFGVSTFEESMNIEHLIDIADKALYKSKENGRNCVSTLQIVK